MAPSDFSKKAKGKKSMLRLALTVLLLAILMIILFTPVDDTSFRESDFYQDTMEGLDSVRNVLDRQPSGKVHIGWGQASITPESPVRLTGNHWQPFDTIYDPVYVRSFIFSNDYHKIALISYDLWIVHPQLAKAISKAVEATDLGITGIYFTASHTHSSVGGWGRGLLGKLVMGGNNHKMVDLLVQSTLTSLEAANTNIEASVIGFGAVSTYNMVINRLDRDGLVDDKIRLLKAKNRLGEQAVFTTFSAHPVYMDKNLNALSSDYPGPLLTYVKELDSIGFASFGAGAMGSHSPVRAGPFVYENLLQYSRHLKDYIAGAEDGITMDSTDILRFAQWPVTMRSPHFRITDHWRVRSWLFHAVLGKNTGYITCLRIGNTVLVGLPVELSGEFYSQFEAICRQKGISLMITSFNGNYLGYVNPEKYYFTISKPETREMNWYGPQAGEYIVALVNEL